MCYEERDCEDFVYMYGYGIKQEIRDYEAERQKAYDAYVEWYQTVGRLTEAERRELEEN